MQTWIGSVSPRERFSLRFLCVLCVSAVLLNVNTGFTAKTQRTQRKRRENLFRRGTDRFQLRPLLLLIVAFLFLTQLATSQTQTQSHPTGVLRLRVRVKIGESTKGLARKRFYLLRGTLDQNKVVIDAAEQSPYVSRDCFYLKLGASQQLIDWLKSGDCESVYCREIEEEFVTGPKAVPEFVTAYAAGEKEFGQSNVGRKWLINNLPTPLREGFYRDRRNALDALLKQAEMTSGARPLSIMTDRLGTAYFTDLEPGTYVLTSLLPIEVGPSLDFWKCELQIKPGDIATETPYQVSNKKDRLVKCAAVEKPIPVCQK